jgi:hypothetical protein
MNSLFNFFSYGQNPFEKENENNAVSKQPPEADSMGIVTYTVF